MIWSHLGMHTTVSAPIAVDGAAFFGDPAGLGGGAVRAEALAAPGAIAGTLGGVGGGGVAGGRAAPFRPSEVAGAAGGGAAIALGGGANGAGGPETMALKAVRAEVNGP